MVKKDPLSTIEQLPQLLLKKVQEYLINMILTCFMLHCLVNALSRLVS